MKKYTVLAVTFLLTVSGALADWEVVGSGRAGVTVLEDGGPLFEIDSILVGPGWSRCKVYETLARAEDGKRVFEEPIGFNKPWDPKKYHQLDTLRYEVEKTGPKTLAIRYMARAPYDAIFTKPPSQTDQTDLGIGPLLTKNAFFADGKAVIESADGTTQEVDLPPPRYQNNSVKSVTCMNSEGETVTFTYDPPICLHGDKDEFRMFTHQDPGPGETIKQIVTVEFPEKIAFEPANRFVDTSEWFEYADNDDFSPGSVIGLEDWLEKPAGQHGWLKVDGDNFTFEDGTPGKFFGVNLSYDDMAPPPEQSDQWNDKWAKHGVNLVRLHKFINHGWAGIMTEDHMVPDPEKLENFEYFTAAARQRGIYTSWSAVFQMKVTGADKERVKYYEEIKKADYNKQSDSSVVLGLKNIALDLQDLIIAQTLNLLNRTNRFTGIRYADDCGLAYIELHNEDDIFMMKTESYAQKWPTYWKDFCGRFCDFLKNKYGSQEALEEEWGAAYPKGKTLANRDIEVIYDAWELQSRCTPYDRDSLYFMYLTQHNFYKKFVKAIRDAGYQGAICGGCWQARCWLGHINNTLTDYEVGFIDRHNYSPTPMHQPGVGNMSVGMQQVRHRPFNFSEWGGGDLAIPTVAIYGLGLQGWDASCQFSSKNPDIINQVNRGCNDSCDDFLQIGQYPALARMTHRGDVKEGDIVANRIIGIESLHEGKVKVNEHFTLLGGGANTKEFSSVVPQASLMAGRVVLEFVEGQDPEEAIIEKATPYIDEENKIIRSNTGELMWDYSGRGFYTVDTPFSQAAIGYISDREIDLADVMLKTPSLAPAKLYVTSLDRKQPIAKADRLLITVLGRTMNTGAVLDEFAERPLEPGGEPLLIEPLTVDVTLKRKGNAKVYALNHDGRKESNAMEIPVNQSGKTQQFTLDGAKAKTVYYLVEF